MTENERRIENLQDALRDSRRAHQATHSTLNDKNELVDKLQTENARLAEYEKSAKRSYDAYVTDPGCPSDAEIELDALQTSARELSSAALDVYAKILINPGLTKEIALMEILQAANQDPEIVALHKSKA